MNTIRVAGLSDCGRQRSANQDHYMIGPMVAQAELWSLEIVDDAAFDRDGLLCAVADGLGGHRGGEVASRLALDIFAREDVAERDRDGVWLARLVRRAHERLLEVAADDPALQDMATTIVGAHVRRDGCTIFHAGDSRLYRLRDGFLNQLTEDHSAAGMGAAFDKDPGRRSSSVIYNCLGGAAGATCSPTLGTEVSLRGGDLLLLCSDGLTDALPAVADIEAVLAGGGSPARRVRSLVDAANAAGGPDNITVVVVEVGASE